jgi:hypothetical protein
MGWLFARAVTRHWRVLRAPGAELRVTLLDEAPKWPYGATGPDCSATEMNTKYSPMLTSRQSRFIEEYLIDLNGKQAAVRAGYSAKSAEVQASRLLRNTAVQAAIGEAMQARSQRTEVTADRVVAELAKLAFADMRDYWPRPGETIDLHRLDEDRTAAVEEIGAVAICVGISLTQFPTERAYWIRQRGQLARRRACVSASAIRRPCAW